MKWKVVLPPKDLKINEYQGDVLIIFPKDGIYQVVCEGESEDRNTWTGMPHKYFGAAKVVVKSKCNFYRG